MASEPELYEVENAAQPVSTGLTRWTADVEAELRRSAFPGDSLLTRMASYHVGLVDAEGQPARAAGKRFRSNLCCWAAEACGGSAQMARPAACAVELVHDFTLVHDDVQDGDRLRRGRPTVWSVWGVGQAINAGDYLFARACQVVLTTGLPQRAEVTDRERARRLDAAQVLLDAVVEVIEGQCLDLGHECAADAGLDTYLRMVEAKTGALIGASLEAGAVMAGADHEVRARIRRAGRLLGVAFQLRDDWLGVWGESGVTGKSRQNDIVRRKLIHPVAMAYEVGSSQRRQRLVALYREPGPDAEPEIRRLLEELAVADLTANAASAWASEAVAEIRGCDLDPVHVEEFSGVADSVARRNA